MVCKKFLLGVLLVTVVWINVAAGDDKEEEMCSCILLAIVDDVSSCSGWEDSPVQVAMLMKLEKGEEDKPDMVKLEGTVDVGCEINDNTFQISVYVYLEHPNGKDLVWSGGSDLCQSMADKDAPWYPLTSAFNTTECPIVPDIYTVPGMRMNLDFAKGCLTKDFIGSYMIGISMEHTRDKIMCFEMGAEIFEDERPCSQCPNQSNGDDDE